MCSHQRGFDFCVRSSPLLGGVERNHQKKRSGHSTDENVRGIERRSMDCLTPSQQQRSYQGEIVHQITSIVNKTNIGSVSKDEKGSSSIRPKLDLFQRTRKSHSRSDQHWICFKGRERVIVDQTNIESVSKDEKGSSSIRPTLDLF